MGIFLIFLDKQRPTLESCDVEYAFDILSLEKYEESSYYQACILGTGIENKAIKLVQVRC